MLTKLNYKNAKKDQVSSYTNFFIFSNIPEIYLKQQPFNNIGLGIYTHKTNTQKFIRIVILSHKNGTGTQKIIRISSNNLIITT